MIIKRNVTRCSVIITNQGLMDHSFSLFFQVQQYGSVTESQMLMSKIWMSQVEKQGECARTIIFA